MSSGELNVLISIPVNSEQAATISKVFDDGWSDGVPLESEQIKRYQKARPNKKQPALPQKSLTWILGKTSKQSLAGKRPDESNSNKIKYWVERMSGFVSKQTEVVLSDETNWDKKGWEWYSAGPNRYVKGHGLLMLDLNGKHASAYLVRIKDVTKTAARTPDGRYFAAYSGLPNTSHRRLIPIAI